MIQVFNIKQGLYFGLLDLKAFALLNQLTLKRDIETKGKEHLINYLTNSKATLTYNDKGKPYLENDSRHISISHSHDKLVVIINDFEPTGIDIELKRDKVLKIKHKFLSLPELTDANDDIEKLIIYWAAKETLYKIYGLKEIDFCNHLFISPFIKNSKGNIIGSITLPDKQQSFELHYQFIDDYILVFVLTTI